MTTPSPSQTLGQLIQSKAARFPDAVVLRFVQVGRPDEVVTYGTLATKSQKLAVTLRPRGLSRGTTFAVMMRKRLLLEHFDPHGPDVFTPSPPGRGLG